MSPVFWIAVLSTLSSVSSMSIVNVQNLILPYSSTNIPAVQIAPYLSTPLPWLVGGSNQSLPLLSSISNLTALSREKVNYGCDTRVSSLLPTECREAWRQIPRHDMTEYSIGNRSADREWDIPLPMRWPSHKGTCNIEVDQIEEGSIMSDDASGPEMSNAAQFLINTCAERMGRGGTAKPLGQRARLALSIKAYKPNLQCDNPEGPVKRFGPMGPIQSILNRMKVSKFEQVFGKAGSSNVQVPLPITIADATGQYFVTIDIEGSPVNAQWYDIWTDAVAVTGICVQNDKWGISTRLVSGNRGVSSLTVAISNSTSTRLE